MVCPTSVAHFELSIKFRKMTDEELLEWYHNNENKSIADEEISLCLLEMDKRLKYSSLQFVYKL
jgi:hypothetical protein